MMGNVTFILHVARSGIQVELENYLGVVIKPDSSPLKAEKDPLITGKAIA